MAIDVQVAARHEAAHSVMFWYVGLLDDVTHVELTLNPTGGMVSARAIDHRCKELSFARKQLLVLLAGPEIAQTLEERHDASDFKKMTLVTSAFFDSSISLKLDDSFGFKDPTHDALLQDAVKSCQKLLPLLDSRITKIAQQLIDGQPDRSGKVKLTRDQIEQCCNSFGEATAVQFDLNGWLESPLTTDQ